MGRTKVFLPAGPARRYVFAFGLSALVVFGIGCYERIEAPDETEGLRVAPSFADHLAQDEAHGNLCGPQSLHAALEVLGIESTVQEIADLSDYNGSHTSLYSLRRITIVLEADGARIERLVVPVIALRR